MVTTPLPRSNGPHRGRGGSAGWGRGAGQPRESSWVEGGRDSGQAFDEGAGELGGAEGAAEVAGAGGGVGDDGGDGPRRGAARPRAARADPSARRASRAACPPRGSATTGLAMPCPAMSGADPCWACATQIPSPALTAPPRPRLPQSSEASSLRMSPNMLVVTMTSNEPGVADQPRRGGVDDQLAQLDVGELRGDLADAAQEQPVGQLEHVGLVHRGHVPAPGAGQLEGRPAPPRRDALAVTLRIENAESASGMNSPLPAYMLRSE